MLFRHIDGAAVIDPDALAALSRGGDPLDDAGRQDVSFVSGSEKGLVTASLDLELPRGQTHDVSVTLSGRNCGG